jgi:hypothetical protein
MSEDWCIGKGIDDKSLNFKINNAAALRTEYKFIGRKANGQADSDPFSATDCTFANS